MTAVGYTMIFVTGDGGEEIELCQDQVNAEGQHGDLHCDSEGIVTHNPILPETAEIIYGGIASLLIFALLYKLAWPQIKKGMAARTERIALGTSVLNLPWYNPVLLARRLATLDVLSGGRLRIGLGIGWSPDEYEATGAPWNTRGKRADECVNALKSIWTTDPVEIEATGFRVAKSIINLKPIQKPHPPIYMASFTPAAMKRVAREANGWFPVGFPLSVIGTMFEQLKTMAQQAGRDPKSFELIVRGNVEFTSAPSKNRADFTGSFDQVAADIETTKKLGAHELVIDVQFSPDIEAVEDILKRMEEIHRVAR